MQTHEDRNHRDGQILSPQVSQNVDGNKYSEPFDAACDAHQPAAARPNFLRDQLPGGGRKPLTRRIPLITTAIAYIGKQKELVVFNNTNPERLALDIATIK
jgi:hypothetical protein